MISGGSLRRGGVALLFISITVGQTAAQERVPPEDCVLAEFAGGGRVTEAHLLAHLAQLGISTPELIAKDPLLDTLPQYIGAVAANRILLASAAAMGMERDPDYLAEVREIERQLRVDALVRERFRIGQLPSEEDVRTYYADHPGEFAVEPEVWFRHIFLAPDSGVDADHLVARLRAGEISFASAAEQHSRGAPSNVAGEVLGPLRKGILLPELEDTVFSIDPGKVSDPIRTGRGTEIILVVRRKEHIPFAQAKAGIPAMMAAERGESFRRLLESLRANAEIETIGEVLPHRGNANHVVAKVDGEILTVRDLLAFIPRRVWRVDPPGEEKELQALRSELVDQVLLAREAARTGLGEDEASRRTYQTLADFHLRQMTYARCFGPRSREGGRRAFIKGEPTGRGEEALDGTSVLEILQRSGFRLLVEPAERLRREWLRS